MSQSVRGLLRGKSNNSRLVTLRAGEVETVLLDANITAETVALLAPRTLEAAIGVVYAETSIGRLVIHHEDLDGDDRIFAAVLVG